MYASARLMRSPNAAGSANPEGSLRDTSPAMSSVVAKYRKKCIAVRIFSCCTFGCCFSFGQIIVAKIAAQPIIPAAALPPK
jgi:hypothetical protein